MISSYKTIIFDCDGVVLNSNKIKSDAFYKVALPYGKENAIKLLKYHISNGGISRYKKFQYFQKEILRDSLINIDALLEEYSKISNAELRKCEVCSCLMDLKNKYRKNKWMVVSGGDEKEIKEVFKKRDIINFFERGIYGSPKSKDEIFYNLLSENKIELPAIYLGDSKYDYEVSKKFSIDFIFISRWTEVDDWEDFCNINSIKNINMVCDLL